MDYTQHDYASLVTELTERFSQVEGWGQGYQTSTGQNLIRLFADATDSLLYMLERRSQEAFISTAVLKRSVVAHASELGYRPRRTVCMTGELTLSLVDSNGQPINAENDVVIERFTEVRSVAPVLDFVTVEEAVIKAGSNSTTLKIKEGYHNQLVIDPTVASFTDNYDYLFTDYELIDEYSIEIDDAGTVYTDVETGNVVFGTLKYATADDAVYDVKYGNDGMRLVFGNGVFGRAPQGTVTIDYIESSGTTLSFNSLGNLFKLPTNRIKDINESLPRKEYLYELTNTTLVRGGLVPETLSSIAENAPENARANNRCVGNVDFEYWGRRSGIGGIVDMNSYGESESGGIILTMNNVNIAYATEDGEALTTNQRQEFLDYLSRYKMTTVHPVLKQANQVIAVINLYARKTTRLPLSSFDFYSYLKGEVENYMAIARGSIGRDLQHSELTEYVQNLRTTINNVTYDAVDFVRIDIHPMYPLKNPIELFDVRVYLDTSYVPNTGDVWSITIDGTQVDTVVQDGDTQATIVERMRDNIMQSVYIISMTEVTQTQGTVLRLRSRYINNSFQIDISGGDLFLQTTTSNVVRIPSEHLDIDGINDVLVAGSVEIVRADMSVYLHDDGVGNLYEVVNGSNINRAKIDYKYFNITGLALPDVNETYYVKYNQNIFQNIDVDEESVVMLSPFADTIDDTPLYSTINVV